MGASSEPPQAASNEAAITAMMRLINERLGVEVELFIFFLLF
jgi:hypothetical protein